MPVSKNQVTFFDKEFKPESLSDVLRITEQDWIEKLIQSLKDNDAVGNSVLIQSMVAEVDMSPNYVSFNIIATGQAAKYFKYVDKGVDGTKVKHNSPYKFKNDGKPVNIDAMLKFMASRGITPKEGKSQEAYESLAFVLGMNQKAKGIKPTNFISEAIGKEEIEKLKKDIGKGFKKGLL